MAIALAAVFALLGAVHLYWALGGRTLMAAAIPEMDGRPLFVPAASLTAAVGGALLLCGVLVGALSGLVPAGGAQRALPWLGYALAALLAGRAVGDFHWVGFFKRERGSRFAQWDSLLYSPLCLLLAAGVGVLAFRVDMVR